MPSYILLAVAVVILLVGCVEADSERATKGFVSPVGGFVTALDEEGLVVVEAIGSSELLIREDSMDPVKCEVSAQMEEAWEELKKLCSHGLQERVKSVDPNEVVYDVVLAFSEPIQNGRYRIGYFRNEEDIWSAASALETIFSGCKFDRRLEYRIVFEQWPLPLWPL